MELAVTKTVEVRTDIFLTVEEIEEILKKHFQYKNAEIRWDESSYGGIRGVNITNIVSECTIL